MSFTAADVKTLREMTGAGMMDCKKALTECDGDMDKAVEYLREKGHYSKMTKFIWKICFSHFFYHFFCSFAIFY